MRLNGVCCSVGCKLVDNNSWPSAPRDIPIIGLKELPESDEPLPHTHIQFAHCYKQQGGWSKVLSRFHRGGGTLYDLEFLNDDSGRRVAAFGFHAGFAGAAAGALAFSAQRSGQKLGQLEPYPNEDAMVSDVKAKLGGNAKSVKALVIGALGRCGRGAVDLFRKIGLEECVCQYMPSALISVSHRDLAEITSSSGIWQKLPRAGLSRKSWMSTSSSTAYTLRARSRLLSRPSRSPLRVVVES